MILISFQGALRSWGGNLKRIKIEINQKLPSTPIGKVIKLKNMFIAKLSALIAFVYRGGG